MGGENLFKYIVSLIDQVTSPQSEEIEKHCVQEARPRGFPGGPVLESRPPVRGLRAPSLVRNLGAHTPWSQDTKT